MRTLLLLVIVGVAVAVVGFGWRPGLPANVGLWPAERSVGTAGRIDVSKARERGAEVGEKAAQVASRIEETVAEAGITSKVKAKMALDDLVRATSVGVSTEGSTVTLTGTVRTSDERSRAVRLAEETDGVTRVVDRLSVE